VTGGGNSENQTYRPAKGTRQTYERPKETAARQSAAVVQLGGQDSV
jgi:hypothetical protein